MHARKQGAPNERPRLDVPSPPVPAPSAYRQVGHRAGRLRQEALRVVASHSPLATSRSGSCSATGGHPASRWPAPHRGLAAPPAPGSARPRRASVASLAGRAYLARCRPRTSPSPPPERPGPRRGTGHHGCLGRPAQALRQLGCTVQAPYMRARVTFILFKIT